MSCRSQAALPPLASRPEVDDKAVARLSRLARWLDTRYRIPGTDFRVGMDGLIGLIPGIGDTLTALLSLYLLAEGRRLGLRTPVLLKMLANVAVDYLLGAIPLFGDVFDIAWKANLKNVELILDNLPLRDRQT